MFLLKDLRDIVIDFLNVLNVNLFSPRFFFHCLFEQFECLVKEDFGVIVDNVNFIFIIGFLKSLDVFGILSITEDIEGVDILVGDEPGNKIG